MKFKWLYIIVPLFLLVDVIPLRAQNASDRFSASISVFRDTLDIDVSLLDSRQQLSSLMQGLTVSLPELCTEIHFPTAVMVRHQVKHHPNEVKATVSTENGEEREVRPDLKPLITALNDTVMTVFEDSSVFCSRSFSIELDREKEIISFHSLIPVPSGLNADEISGRSRDSVVVHLSSIPDTRNSNKEYSGRKLSREIAPQPNGLGMEPAEGDVSDRTVNLTAIVELKYVTN